ATRPAWTAIRTRWRASTTDILAHAYAQCRSNKGAPGVDRQDFEAVEAYGVERWLGELALALRLIFDSWSIPPACKGLI
ncbi:MAG TPA: hypothetical protein VED87_09095, partial [Methylocystis sp.]|nr:hypothetical protein [Methylocystis sp.]